MKIKVIIILLENTVRSKVNRLISLLIAKSYFETLRQYMSHRTKNGEHKRMTKQKIVLITGASSGIGYQAAEKLSAHGFKVYGAARRIEKMSPLSSLGIIPLKVDLTDEHSIKSAVAHVISQEGQIDILINNAGYGSYGAIENVPIEEAKKINLKLICLALPLLFNWFYHICVIKNMVVLLTFHLWQDV